MYFKHGKGRQWTPEQKMVAFGLHFKSPASYRLLRTMFALPSLTSLKRCLSGLETNPGYNETIFTLLQSKLTSMYDKKKVVVVCFDEMLLSACFRDLGPGIGRTTARANEALVVMVKCLFDKWKQPIRYFLSGNAMEGDTLKVIIEDVEKLLNIGFEL